MRANVHRAVGNILQHVGLKDPLKLAANEVLTRLGLPAYAPRLDPALQWRRILANSQHILRSLPPAKKPVVAFLTSVGTFSFTGYDLVVAQAVRLRGARPLMLLCGGSLGACDNVVVETCQGGTPDTFLSSGPRFFCAKCQAEGQRLYDAAGLDVLRFSELITTEARDSVHRALQQIAPGKEFDATYKGVEV